MYLVPLRINVTHVYKYRYRQLMLQSVHLKCYYDQIVTYLFGWPDQ